MWLVENWHHALGGLKIVRAIGVSVTALPLTMDTRARYGTSLSHTLGRWAERVFNLITAIGCLTLATIACIELALGAIQASAMAHIIALYVFLMLVGTYVSLGFTTPRDKARSVHNMQFFLAGLAMGMFGGIFRAAPAFSVLRMAQNTPGIGLGDYLKCESVALWQKVVAVLP
ncbi:hypothetical protein LTR17_006542 [Elasticomyces elasticus]|nr:hypothetical protein LTR17_006542 [Elasticomyces elasticus]